MIVARLRSGEKMTFEGKDGPCVISCTGTSVAVAGESHRRLWVEKASDDDGVFIRLNPPDTLGVWLERRGLR